MPEGSCLQVYGEPGRGDIHYSNPSFGATAPEGHEYDSEESWWRVWFPAWILLHDSGENQEAQRDGWSGGGE